MVAAASPLDSSAQISPAVRGAPLAVLRAEGVVALAAAAWAYHQFGGSWIWFLGLFFAPDLSMLGYLAGPRVGALVYNAAHTYASPALLALVGLASGQPSVALGALVWAGHIGFDRGLGYGLKYSTAFGDTHLSGKTMGIQVRSSV